MKDPISSEKKSKHVTGKQEGYRKEARKSYIIFTTKEVHQLRASWQDAEEVEWRMEDEQLAWLPH